MAAPIGELGTLNTPFFPGDGNSNTNFIIDTNDDLGIEIGIKAKARFQGELPFEDMAYQAISGESDPGLATWNVDFSLDFGEATIDEFDVFFTLDFNPLADSLPALIPFQQDMDPETPLVTNLLQGSQNLGFSFFQGLSLLGIENIQPFDPFAEGEYQIGLTVLGEAGVIAQVDTLVNVSNVPVPAALPLMAFGLGGLVWVGRKRKAKA